MSFFAIRVALYWIEKAVTQNPDQHWDRVVQWSLMILNHQKRPKTISTWQFGCPELYPGMIYPSVWYRTRSNPYGPIGEGLRSTGIWNKSQFPWAQKIEAAFEDIKIELLSLKSHMQGFQQYRAPTSASSIQVSLWSKCVFFFPRDKYDCDNRPKTVLGASVMMPEIGMYFIYTCTMWTLARIDYNVQRQSSSLIRFKNR